MHKLYVGLGSNLGDKEKNLNQAIQYIKERIGAVIAQSAFISTVSWGYESDNLFLNAALICRTSLTPYEVLSQLQAIELEMGRTHTLTGYEDRVIDLDILFYDDLILNSEQLTIPHPLIHQRLFVLEPLVQIAPNAVHPLLKQNIKELVDTYK